MTSARRYLFTLLCPDRDSKMPMKSLYLSKGGNSNVGVWIGMAGPADKTPRIFLSDASK